MSSPAIDRKLFFGRTRSDRMHAIARGGEARESLLRVRLDRRGGVDGVALSSAPVEPPPDRLTVAHFPLLDHDIKKIVDHVLPRRRWRPTTPPLGRHTARLACRQQRYANLQPR